MVIQEARGRPKNRGKWGAKIVRHRSEQNIADALRLGRVSCCYDLARQECALQCCRGLLAECGEKCARVRLKRNAILILRNPEDTDGSAVGAERNEMPIHLGQRVGIK